MPRVSAAAEESQKAFTRGASVNRIGTRDKVAITVLVVAIVVVGPLFLFLLLLLQLLGGCRCYYCRLDDGYL